MIHIKRNISHFNIPYKLYLNDHYYKTFSYVGNFKIGKYKGPSGCNAISEKKNISLKKSFSESLERRALMLGGNLINSNGNVVTFDLFSKNISELPFEYSKYKANNPMCSDTTGTAAHTCSEEAIKNAMLELIGKNALFLFWYGKKGYVLQDYILDNENEIQALRREGIKLNLFVNIDFAPTIVVFAFLFDEKYIYSSGVGASLSLDDSIKAAVEEAILLKWQNEMKEFSGFNSILTNNNYHRECIKYIEESYKNNYCYTQEKSVKTDSIDEIDNIIRSFPNWVEDLHVIFLRNTIKSNIKIVKIFSKDLNNHIPLKQRINLGQTININTIKLRENDLNNIPDCIII